MRVELVWWRGCPSWQEAHERLRAAMAALNEDPEAVQLVEVESDADAEQESFVGSPTFRVDGEDLFPPGGEPAGLTCRLYRLPDGRPAPLPGQESLTSALARALARSRS